MLQAVCRPTQQTCINSRGELNERFPLYSNIVSRPKLKLFLEILSTLSTLSTVSLHNQWSSCWVILLETDANFLGKSICSFYKPYQREGWHLKEFTVYILLCQCGSVRVYSLHFTVPVWQCWSIKSVWAGQMIDK